MKSLLCMLFIFLPASISFADCPQGDVTGDCKVNMDDLTQIAAKWLTDGVPDIACEGDVTGDCKVNMADIAQLATDWLTEGVPSPDIIWVYIDDSGTDMKDNDGNLISKGGFTGYMSKYETTNAQYCQYLNAALASGDIRVSDGYVYGNSGPYSDQIYFATYEAYSSSQISYNGAFSVRTREGHSMANHPAASVCWYGATAFASYYGWRLPTEWEWQAVADYNGSYTFGCGTTINISKANCFGFDGSTYRHSNPLGLTSYPWTSPVGYYPAYGYGLCDMAGNAWEWTDSWFSTNIRHRVLRGGSWGGNDINCRVSNRYYDGFPGTIGDGIGGFRVCR